MSRPALPRLIVITDEHLGAPALRTALEQAMAAGCHALQLRRKRDSGRDQWLAAEALRESTRRHRALLLINDRIDIALGVDADGVHLPGGAMAPVAARRLLGPNRLLGASVHSLAEIEAADAATLDYLQYGPVFPTPSKAAFGAPQGLEGLARAADLAHARGLLLVAVGGIDAGRAAEVAAAGADSMAVIAAVQRAADVTAVTTALLAAWP
jgi:thiamine-phosphate diphosphorylase